MLAGSVAEAFRLFEAKQPGIASHLELGGKGYPEGNLLERAVFATVKSAHEFVIHAVRPILFIDMDKLYIIGRDVQLLLPDEIWPCDRYWTNIMKISGNHKGEATMDRRVIRTRRSLQHAFLRLIIDKGYDAVSIQDICEAADVGRSTFYLHFKDKDDLKRSGLEHLRRDLIEHREKTIVTNSRLSLDFSRPMFEHARDHLHIYRALVGSSGGGVALETIRRILVEQLKDDPWIMTLTSAQEREFRVQFVLGAFMSVLTWWLDGGGVIEVGEVDRLFRRATGLSD